MPIIRRKEITETANNDSLLQNLKKSYNNVPPAVSAVLWAGIGYAALQGVMRYQNEGFFNDVVLVPIVEEVLFRLFAHGVIEKTQQIWNKFNKTEMDETSIRNRVLAASLLFGVNHYTFGQAFWNLGRGCGYLYEQTGSLAPAIALHMYHNYISYSALRPYVRQEFTYPVLFYALGKKMFPIPDFVTKPISSIASKVTKYCASAFK